MRGMYHVEAQLFSLSSGFSLSSVTIRLSLQVFGCSFQPLLRNSMDRPTRRKAVSESPYNNKGLSEQAQGENSEWTMAKVRQSP